MKAAHLLGDLLKNTDEMTALNHAVEDYERDEELNGLIGEFNAQQELMLTSSDADEELKGKLSDRLDELYNKITSHPVYLAYMNAKNEFDRVYSEAVEEIQFAITGERPCSHDCSSCGGCH